MIRLQHVTVYFIKIILDQQNSSATEVRHNLSTQSKMEVLNLKSLYKTKWRLQFNIIIIHTVAMSNGLPQFLED